MPTAADYRIGGNDEHGQFPPTPGKRTPVVPGLGRQIYENEFNRAAKEYFLAACLRNGFRVFDVKTEYNDIAVSTRVARVNAAGLSALVTFAYNAFGDGTSFNSVNGYQVFYGSDSRTPQASRLLAFDVLTAMQAGVENVSRGVAALSGVGVLGSVNCPSVLIEAGFMTNLADVTRMLDPDYRRAVGESACRGVCDYFGVPYSATVNIASLPTLRRGSSSNAVTYLQYLLRINGYDPAPDGVFGALTEAAVRRFQQDNGLTVDGIVGKNTWNALLGETPPTLRRGSRGRWVRYLQAKLTSRFYPVGEIDGVFGAVTEREVRNFQQNNGLAVDGIVGKNTWAALGVTP